MIFHNIMVLRNENSELAMKLKPITSHDTGLVLLTLVYGGTHKIS